MDVIAGLRGNGKSTKIIELAAKGGGYIVCPTRNDQERLFHELAKKENLDIRFPITWPSFINGQFYAAGITEFYFDDIDRMLASISRGVPIKAISLTADNIHSYL